jgi:Ion channel
MLSAMMMFRRFVGALRHAWSEEDFAPILAAAATLIVVGTLAYALGEDWSVIDAFYFAVATLTTSSIADPDLVLTDPWLKVFTAFYVLVGIGILVEVARRLGLGIIAVQQKERAEKAAAKEAKGES